MYTHSSPTPHHARSWNRNVRKSLAENVTVIAAAVADAPGPAWLQRRASSRTTVGCGLVGLDARSWKGNVRKNLAENVTVIAAAVADAPGPAWLQRRASRPTSPQPTVVRQRGDVAVSTVSLASCATRGIAPDVIKIDVEGA